MLAADQFMVERHDTSGHVGRTIIAGYPWFTDWGRDTMISLPGLALETGRVTEATEILRTFAAVEHAAPPVNRAVQSCKVSILHGWVVVALCLLGTKILTKYALGKRMWKWKWK